jgi:hypothetical protein
MAPSTEKFLKEGPETEFPESVAKTLFYSHMGRLEAVVETSIESLSSTSDTNTDVFTSVLILVPGILKR